MAKKPTESKPQEPELRPDGWQRFEGAVDAAMKLKTKVSEKAKRAAPPKQEKPRKAAKAD